jgi:hypothetical protein
MTSAHTTLRELVTHLARAQRAFDAGHLDEAERAIADALALDPHNVQAADLRQRIRKDRQPADQGRAARAAAVGPRSSPMPVAPGASAVGRVSPAAWSTFEGRVRGRRADRAVADAQEALGRGDAEAAQAALAELDAVSPGDPRRDAIVASLEPRRSVERIPVITPADSGPRRPDPAPRLAAPLARPMAAAPPRAPSARRPAAAASVSTPAAGGARSAATAPAAAPPTSSDVSLAELPIDISSHVSARDIASAAAPRVVAGAPVRTPRRSARTAVGFAAVAASALVGFWMFSAGGFDPIPAGPVPNGSQTESAATPEAATASQGDLPEVLPSFTPPVIDGGEQAVAPSTDPVGAPFETVAESAATVPSPQPDVPRATSGSSTGSSTTPPPFPLDNRAREPARTPAVAAPDVARREPSPVSPLAAPVESPIRAPETRRLAGPSGGEPLTREVTPLPAPLPPAASAASGTTASPAVASGAVETSAVRDVLDGYADAFSTLNADATQRVWPGVDVRGLRRAFDQLSTQNITFNRCEVNAAGETAQAVCTGRATWVPKVGDRSPKSEPRTWRFALGRDDGAWVIDGVQVQR